MTKTFTAHYVVCLLLAFMAIGLSTATASEVTGTLSSDTNEQLSGNEVTGTVSSDATDNSLSGTVQSPTTSSGSGGTSRNSGSSATQTEPDSPSGAVLGTADESSPTPGFPNTGQATPAGNPVSALWSAIVTFFQNLVSP